MTRILLVGNYEPDQQHSMLRYGAWLKDALAAQGFQVSLITPQVRAARLIATGNPARKWLGYVDKFVLFPFFLLAYARRYDVIHICDHSNSPYRFFVGKTPVAVTCHDLIGIMSMRGEFDGQRPRWSGRLLQRWILSALKTIDFVCCVSDRTRHDLDRVAPNGRRRTRVIPNPVVDFAPMPASDAESALRDVGINTDIPFFLSVGSNLWYKNRPGIIRLFTEALKRPATADMYLVFAGAELPPEARAWAVDLGLESRIKEIVSPSAHLLRALYSTATVLLFPSLYEGFGWPIVEAQACGCPVITSDREPMKGIAGAAGFLVDPCDPAAASAMIDLHWSWITSRRQASLVNARRFSPAVAADEYEIFFREVEAFGKLSA